MQAFSMWLNKRIVVDTDGSVKNVTVEQGVCEELDNLVVSLIQQSPEWEPATVNGKPEPQCLTIPITFQMR